MSESGPDSVRFLVILGPAGQNLQEGDPRCRPGPGLKRTENKVEFLPENRVDSRNDRNDQNRHFGPARLGGNLRIFWNKCVILVESAQITPRKVTKVQKSGRKC